MASNNSNSPSPISCPVCEKSFEKHLVEDHVNKCLFLNSSVKTSSVHKRCSSHLMSISPKEKRLKFESKANVASIKAQSGMPPNPERKMKVSNESIPLAERMRPVALDDMVGQKQVFGPGSMLGSLLEQKKIPNMILWGPPGCGKTSLANVVANICKEQNNMRFVKLSATMSGISDVKEVVQIAKNEAQFKRHTILFMDEIHRFNKLQQDTFLPHVENGTITLIGATTENPSFSLNNALLSRCRVVVLEKLTVDEVLCILKRSLEKSKQAVVVKSNMQADTISEELPSFESDAEREIRKPPTSYLDRTQEASLKWLAEICDGDARVALGALELALTARDPRTELHVSGPSIISLEDIKDGIKRTHMLYDRKGEEHYNIVSAIHKSIRASDDNAALYWTTRALRGGEDPLYIARRLIRAAGEDIGLADPNAVSEAIACLHGCQHIGMPECDVLLAQCAVRLARAPKSREVYTAMKRCQAFLAQGALPPVPLHLRNAPTKLMKQQGYGAGYNLSHKDESGLMYMPEGLEDKDFFRHCEDDF